MDGLGKTQRALKVETPGHMTVFDGASIPSLSRDEVLVKVTAVAINPFDGKSADLSPALGATAGCDFAGTIVAVGDSKTHTLGIGDRVCGFVFGNNPDRPDNGAFAEYVAAPSELLIRVPSTMSDEAAATIGVGIATAGLVLYHELGLPFPSAPETDKGYFLVYGGSTATGTMAIQMLRLSGWSVICTCSPHSFAIVQRLGATRAFDYRSPTCGDEIRAFTGDQLAYAMDCITSTTTMKICYESLGSTGGRYVSLDPFPLRGHTRRSVKPSWVLALTMHGKAIPWVRPYKRSARPQDRVFAQRWMKVAERLLAAGEIVPHPHTKMHGGLDCVADGVETVRTGQLSGVKLVYRIG